MKNLLRMLVIAAVAATFALPVVAQDAAATSAASAQDEQAKADLYLKFTELIKKKDPESQKQAYDIGKQYVAKYPTPKDDAETQILNYVRNWVGKYEKAVRDFELKTAIAKDPSRAFQIGREILASDPENLEVNLQLVQAGYNSLMAKNEANNAAAAEAARRALQLVEQNKTVQDWTPFNNRDESIGGLNYFIGWFTLKSSPEQAIKNLLSAAQSNTKFKTEPTTYAFLASAYYESEFKRLAADYKTRFEGKDETEESKAAYATLMQSLDRVIDAYARAAALAKDPAQKKEFTDRVTALYKSRYETSTAADVQNVINTALSRPVPQPGQPVALPAPPSATPAATGTTSGSTTPGAAANTTTPAATNTGAGAAKPAATPNGTKPATGTTPKPRRK